MGWAEGFNSGSAAASRIVDTYYRAKEHKDAEEQKAGLQRIANQNPERVDEASGADQLAAAQAGLEAAKAANPENAAAIEAAYAPTIAGLQEIRTNPAGEHYSMGEGNNFTQFDHAPTTSEQLGVKSNEMADVLSRSDPVKAMQLRHNAAVTGKLDQENADQKAIRDAYNGPGLQRMEPHTPSATEGNGSPRDGALGISDAGPQVQAPNLSTTPLIDRGQAIAADAALKRSAARPAAAAYYERKAPAIIDTYLRQGKVAEAKQFRDFIDSEDGRSYANNWAHGVRLLATGDYHGAIGSFEKMYNNQLFPDGKTVKLSPLDDGKNYRIEFYGPNGELTGSGTRPTADFAKMAGQMLAPEKMVEFMAKSQAERDKEASLLDRNRQLEDSRFEREQTREDRRDARQREFLDARYGGDGGARLTVPQQRTNESILAARRQLTDMTQDEVLRKTQATTATGRENPEYDPQLARTVKFAQTRLYGDDQAHDDFTAGRARPTNTGTATTRQPGNVQQRFTTDPAMKGMRMGRQTDRGTEVLDASGKLVGHYR